MLAARERVVPPYQSRGMLWLAAAMGGVNGVVVSVFPTDGFLPPGDRVVVDIAAFIGWYLSGAFVFALFVSLITQHRGAVYWTGFVYWFALAASMFVAGSAVHDLNGGSTLLTLDVLLLPVWGIVGGLVGGMIQFGWRAIVREFIVVLVEQDGLTCWRCAYRIGAESIKVCPECGTEVDASRFRMGRLHRIVGAMRTRSRSAFMVLAVIGIALVGYALTTRGLPIRRFNAAMPPGAKLEPVPIAISSPPAGAEWATGALFELDKRKPGIRIALAFAPGRSEEIPLMQVSVVEHRLTPAGDRTGWIAFGAPRIVCNLNEAQAEHVLAHGVPASLMAEMRRKPDEVRWVSQMIPVPRVGGPATSGDVHVDPTPHFPTR